MTKQNVPVDKVRASRDGHEYHEMWMARKSLELLNPNSELKAIAVEGLSPVDQKSANAEEVEIADAVLYYGGKNFKSSTKVTIFQFKYSVAYRNKPVRISDAKKTIEKFSEAYKSHVKRFGNEASKKLRFQFITNRPISHEVDKMIKNLANGVKNTGKLLDLEKQFKEATKLKGNELKEFAASCKFLSYVKLLSASKSELENILISLSATSDCLASSRLGKLKELVRAKAGTSGDSKNTIEHTDVFEALGMRDFNDLLPCPEALSSWGETLVREQTASTVKIISSSKKPVLLHGTGGVGKTVFMKNLAEHFSENHEVVFFDSFGGGSYRSTEDARHLAKHGLIHIANTLSFRGLCDPILPNTPDEQALAKTFRGRLEQCLNTLRRLNSNRRIYIFIDAIDNAEFAAKQNGETAFAKILLEGLHDKPINGVTLVVSCRTERKPITYAKYNEIFLSAFSKNEATNFLKSRIKNPSSAFIDSAFSRSGGNARVLDYFIESKEQVSKNRSILKLDDLLYEKIEKAIETASQRGSPEKDLTTFLSGLTLLAPPVSIDDYALANKVNAKAIASMVSDLAPLLELSKYGVVFKDEPTETLIINKYGSNEEDLKKISKNLLALQDQSVFAAKTLPDLLYKLKDEKSIYSLAQDKRIPSSIKSDVGKIKIKYARLKVAAKYAAETKDFDKLIGFLVEISSIAEFDQRGLSYLLKHPNLVAELNDSDAIRRIHEARTEWAGTRHSRLGLIHTLKGDLEEAHEHVRSLQEWVDQYLRMDERSRIDSKAHMNATDCVAEPLFSLAKKNPKDAANYFLKWGDRYSFDVAKQLYRYLPLAVKKKVISKDEISIFHENLKSVSALLAALFFYDFSKKDKSALFNKLASLLNKKSIEFPENLTSKKDFLFQKCFLYASLDSLRCNNKKSAKSILEALGSERPRMYVFKERYYYNDSPVAFLLREVLRSIVTGKELLILDILPDELFAFGKVIKSKDKQIFLKKLKEKIEAYLEDSQDKDDSSKIIRSSDRTEIDDFINRRLPQFYSLAVSVRNLLNSPDSKMAQPFNKLIEVWESISTHQSGYRTDQIDHVWVQAGYEVIIFSLFTLNKVKEKDLNKLLASKNLENIGVSSKVAMVQTISALVPNSDLAEKFSHELSKQIELENDVTTRAKYYANVAQSLLLVNKNEAIEYFKKGLLSIEAIGSGDYRYVNELLIFAASLSGKEMNPVDFHYLSNLCELNMTDEPDKFYWGSYGAAFSKIAGLRGLAQLSRWDDRQKIDLSHTLLPSLIALVKDRKLSPKDALALNYLASPVEYHFAGTSEFVNALSSTNLDALAVKELIHQFTLNNAGVPMSSTIKSLAELSEKVLGKNATETIDLNRALSVYSELINKSNHHNNLHSSIGNEEFKIQQAKKRTSDKKMLLKKIHGMDPSNRESFKASLRTLDQFNSRYELKDFYFSELRKKVSYTSRKAYIENLASIEDGEFHWFWIIEELNKCYEEWGKYSISLRNAFKEAGPVLLHQHSVDLIGGDYLSHRDLDLISKFSGISVPDLTLELVQIGTQHDVVGSGAVWLSIATLLSEKISNNVGQSSLRNLLQNESTKLGKLASDGQYRDELYPSENTVKILAGLTWKVLGSYDAKERWRAGHSIRCFAKFGRWDVISELVNLISKRDAGAFQCSDIKFYDYHARLWLLISLARIALDHPKKIAAYKTKLLPFTKEDHVLIRHFAAKTLLECHKVKPSFLTATELTCLLQVNQTQKPLVNESKTRLNFYQGRPEGKPKPDCEFYLEYDFGKMNVDSLGRAFNLDYWKVKDLVAESARGIDPNVFGYNRQYRSTPNEETYGEQVAWHALLITAGKLLLNHSATKNDWKENSWDDWLSDYLLTREDGLWESDALDIIPLEIKNILLKEQQGKLVLTEDRNVLLGLANLKNKPSKPIVIDGHWTSIDGITVSISSALVQKKCSKKAVMGLSKERSVHVWLPTLHGEDESGRFGAQNDYNLIPWIVSIESYKKLDKFDPYGVDTSQVRSRILKQITEKYKLSSTDDFKRDWTNECGRSILICEAWRGPTSDRRSKEHSGVRLTCSADFLKALLKDCDANLIILIHLTQYVEQNYGRSAGELFHSIGVAEVNEKLEIKYFKGRNGGV